MDSKNRVKINIFQVQKRLAATFLPRVICDEKPLSSPGLTTRAPAADLSRAPAPDLSRAPAPDLSRAPAPDLSRTPAPDLSRTPAPDLSRAPAPDLSRALARVLSATESSENQTDPGDGPAAEGDTRSAGEIYPLLLCVCVCWCTLSLHGQKFCWQTGAVLELKEESFCGKLRTLIFLFYILTHRGYFLTLWSIFIFFVQM